MTVREKTIAATAKCFVRSPLYPAVHRCTAGGRKQRRELEHLLAPVIHDREVVREGLDLFMRSVVQSSRAEIVEILSEVQDGSATLDEATDRLVDDVFCREKFSPLILAAFTASSPTPPAGETLAEVRSVMLDYFLM